MSYNDDWLNDSNSTESSDSNEQPYNYQNSDDDLFSNSGRRRSAPTQKKKPKKALTAIAILAVIAIAVGLLSNLFTPDTPPSLQNSTIAPTLSLPPVDSIEQTLPATQEPSIQEILPIQTEPTQEQTASVRYQGQKLPASQQKVYLQLVEGLANHESRIPNLLLQQAENIEQISQAVFLDYGELFWYTGGYSATYQVQGRLINMTFSPTYRWDKATSIAYATFVENKTANLIAQSMGLSDYEKVKTVYEYLIDNTIYDHAYSGATIYDLLYHGRSVCNGYARTAQYLLNKLGVEVIYVQGDGYSYSAGTWESHAWNIVQLGGQYYQMDATWGDPVSKDGRQTKNFHYLCLTTEEISRDHRSQWENYPDCTATYYNYYRYEGHYLTSFDTDQLKQWIIEENATGKELVFRVADETLYEKILKDLIRNSAFHDLFKESIGGVDIYYHSENQTYHIFTITW